MSAQGLPDRIGAVVGGVIRQAMLDAGASGVLLLERESPEGRLAAAWAEAAIGPDHIHGGIDAWDGLVDADPLRLTEARRAAARAVAAERNWLLAHPANKTALLLGRSVPPEPLLPLGDLYASGVRDIAGEYTLPTDVSALAEAAGGVGVLDAALMGWLEERRPLDEATRNMPAAVRIAFAERLRLNRPIRRWPRRVPKLGARTLWIDIFA